MTPLEARLTQDNERLAQENKLLRQKVDLLVKRIFGATSEQLDETQLMLLLQGEAPAKKPEASSDALQSASVPGTVTWDARRVAFPRQTANRHARGAR